MDAVLALRAPEAPRALLADLLRLYRDGLREPLHFFPKTSLAFVEADGDATLVGSGATLYMFPGGSAFTDLALDSGQSASIGRIRWVIDEDFLYAYRSYELIDGGNDDGRDTDFHPPRVQPGHRSGLQRHRGEHDRPPLVRASVHARRLVDEPRAVLRLPDGLGRPRGHLAA